MSQDLKRSIQKDLLLGDKGTSLLLPFKDCHLQTPPGCRDPCWVPGAKVGKNGVYRGDRLFGHPGRPLGCRSEGTLEERLS